jgi:hypothetical protein
MQDRHDHFIVPLPIPEKRPAKPTLPDEPRFVPVGRVRLFLLCLPSLKSEVRGTTTTDLRLAVRRGGYRSSCTTLHGPAGVGDCSMSVRLFSVPTTTQRFGVGHATAFNTLWSPLGITMCS